MPSILPALAQRRADTNYGALHVDAVCALLEQRGVTLLTGPVDRVWGMRTATFTDPDGHSWEIAQELPQAADS
jgi:uncharacterized glyoxalase superfamily protein PhnB